MTKLRPTRLGKPRCRAASDLTAAAAGVERIGVDGRSVTYVAGPLVVACDGAARAREGRGDSCGGAIGKRRAGVLTDPRLELANCLDADGNPVGFLWVEAPPQARWLVVERERWLEVYETAGDVPVRVVVDGVEPDRGVVAVTTEFFTARGRAIGRKEVEARVAG